MERGLDICGIDLSSEMLAKLKEKAPNANVIKEDILEYDSEEKFDYIFISSGSVSLFTDMEMCRKILQKNEGSAKKKMVGLFSQLILSQINALMIQTITHQYL